MPRTKTTDSDALRNVLVTNNLRFDEQSASPSTPPSGQLSLFVDTNGRVWAKNDAGVEYPLMALDLIEVAKGNIAGHSLIHKFGRNPVVPNASFEQISFMSTTSVFLTAPTTVRIKAGGHANDDAGGANLQSVVVHGIDDSLALASETIVTAGAGASTATTTSFWRLYRIEPGGVGTYGANNAGDIVIENSAGGTDLIMIGAGVGQSQFGAFAIPTGTTGYLLSAQITVDANKPADIRFCIRDNFNDTTDPMSAVRIRKYWDGVIGVVDFLPKSPIPLASVSDAWFDAMGQGAATEVSVDFELLLVLDGF